MKVLQLNRELFELYNVRYGLNGISWLTILVHQIKVTLMFICLFFGWSSSVVFIFIHVKTDLQRSLYAVFQVAAELTANYTVLIACLYPELVDNIFIKLNDLRENGNFIRLNSVQSFQFNHVENLNGIHWNLKMFSVIDYSKSYSKCFEPVDRLCHNITQLMVTKMLLPYAILSAVQGILNAVYCYYRDDGIDPQCLYIAFTFS